VVDPQDPVSSAEAGLGGKADVVFECVGVPGLIAQAVEQVRPRGTILLLGLCTTPDTFNSFAMLGKEVKLVTSAFFTVWGLIFRRCAIQLTVWPSNAQRRITASLAAPNRGPFGPGFFGAMPRAPSAKKRCLIRNIVRSLLPKAAANSLALA